MRQQVLFVHEPQVCQDLDVLSLLPGGGLFDFTKVSWSALRVEPSIISTADLIVACARFELREAIDLWRRMAGLFLNKIWFAILPK